jgi:hypothetical protein
VFTVLSRSTITKCIEFKWAHTLAMYKDVYKMYVSLYLTKYLFNRLYDLLFVSSSNYNFLTT